MKKKLLIIPVLAIFTIFGYLSFNSLTPNKSSLGEVLGTQFNNHYITKTDQMGDLIVSVANSSYPAFSETKPSEYDPKAAPMIVVQDAKTHQPKATYELKFVRKNNNDYNDGNQVYPTTIDFTNIDQDPDKELVTTWEINWGGSDGIVGLIILDKVGDKLVPLPTLPKKAEMESNFYLVDKKSGNQVEYGTTAASYFLRVMDINQDNKAEILLGDYIWGDDEGHYGDHFWDLFVYELGSDNPTIPSWWNNGQVFKTTEKIGFGTDSEFKLIETFKAEVN